MLKRYLKRVIEEKKIIYARSTDEVGNTSGVITYTVPDRTAPKSPKLSEELGTIILEAIDEDITKIEYSLDGENWST